LEGTPRTFGRPAEGNLPKVLEGTPRTFGRLGGHFNRIIFFPLTKSPEINR
jgi:hypothetical protein